MAVHRGVGSKRHVLASLVGVAALLALAAGGYALGFGRSSHQARQRESPSLLKIQDRNLLFTYHVPTDTEGLFDLSKDPKCLHNLVNSRPADAARLRRALERRLGVRDLREMLNPNDRTVQTLRGLGYL